ncbi:MAG TPA: hypothetical protein VFS15_10325 [Kofleriaceae bacterium]|nr:hypothetical protein [Kofleriaceae bacterium]
MTPSRFAFLGLVLLGACAAPRHQTHVTTYPDHTVRWQVETTNGVPDGLSRTWHENGRLASRGVYRHGIREGVWIYWDDAGNEVSRDTFRGGQLVARNGARPAPAPAAVAASPQFAEARPVSTDTYTVLRASTGIGGSTSAVRVDGEGSNDAAILGFGLQLHHRDKMWVYGGSANLGGEVFGASHYHFGGVFGLASPGDTAHVELLGEGGVHFISGLGTDLFTSSAGNNDALLPYVGGQLRLDMDPGAPGHVRIDVAVAGRLDLSRSERQVMTTTCFFGCSDGTETWRVGGQTFDVTLGVSYQFE